MTSCKEHGLGLAEWRLGELEAAHRIMERLLWVDPADAMGASVLLAAISAGEPYARVDRAGE